MSTLASSPDRAREVDALLRARCARWSRPSAYQLYVTILFGTIGGSLIWHALAAAVGSGLDAQTLLVFVPVVLILVLLAALRFGVWQGPVAFSAAEVALLLSAPIAIADLVRPRLDHAFLVGAVVGALVAVVVLLLLPGGPGEAGLARSASAVVGLAGVGLLAVAAGWLVQSSRRAAGIVLRATPAIAVLAGGLLAAASGGALGRSFATWSGPWGWAIAPFAGSQGWPLALAVLVLTAAAAATLARRRAGAASVEQFLVRSETRDRISASTILLDYRMATLTHRAVMRRGTQHLRRVRRPRSARLVVLWRDGLALLRNPSRASWATLLGAAGTWEAITHPGQPIPAGLGVVALYLSASLLCEPLRVDVDHPDKSRLLLSWPFGKVLAAHCALPTIVLFAIAAAAIIAAVLAGAVAVGALALIPTILAPAIAGSVLCAALATRRGGRITETVLRRLFTTDLSNPFGWLLIVFWLAPWLVLSMLVIGGPLLLLGHAIAHHHTIVSAGILALVVIAAAAATLLAHARRSTTPA